MIRWKCVWYPTTNTCGKCFFYCGHKRNFGMLAKSEFICVVQIQPVECCLCICLQEPHWMLWLKHVSDIYFWVALWLLPNHSGYIIIKTRVRHIFSGWTLIVTKPFWLYKFWKCGSWLGNQTGVLTTVEKAFNYLYVEWYRLPPQNKKAPDDSLHLNRLVPAVQSFWLALVPFSSACP